MTTDTYQSATTESEHQLIRTFADQVEEVLDRVLMRGFSLVQSEDCAQLEELAVTADDYGLASAHEHLHSLVSALKRLTGGQQEALSDASQHFHFLTEYAVILRQLSGLDLQEAMMAAAQQREELADP